MRLRVSTNLYELQCYFQVRVLAIIAVIEQSHNMLQQGPKIQAGKFRVYSRNSWIRPDVMSRFLCINRIITDSGYLLTAPITSEQIITASDLTS